MTNTVSSQTDNQILSQYRGLRAQVYKHKPSPRNKGSEQNLVTRKEAPTLADFVVMLAQNMVYSFAHKPINQTQDRGFRWVKILY